MKLKTYKTRNFKTKRNHEMGGGNKEKKIKREVGILQGKQKLPLRPPEAAIRQTEHHYTKR